MLKQIKSLKRISSSHKTASLRLFFLLTILILLVSCVKGSLIQQNSSSNTRLPSHEVIEPNFYYYKDQRISLHPVPGKFAVRLQPTVSSAQLPTLLSERGLRVTIEAAPLGWYVVQNGAGEVQSALSQSELIERTVPVYRADDGTEFFIPEQFFVQFNPSVSEEEIRALNEQYGVFIVQKNEWLGNNYLLQVNDQANKSALELANVYHESPLTEYAAPNFVRITISP